MLYRETTQVFPIPADEPPKVTDHPKSLKDAVLYEPVTFSIKATGTEPLNYQWEHKTRDGNGEWQSCDLETFPGANSQILTIPRLQKSNEGSYSCTVSNLAGTETSQCAILTLGELNYMHTLVHNLTLKSTAMLSFLFDGRANSSTFKVLSYAHTMYTSMHSIVFQDRASISILC